MKFRLFLTVSVGMALGLGPVRAVDTNSVLNAWLAVQAKAQFWSADFTQTRHLKTFTQPLTSKGKLWFAAPNQFRWELGDPPRTVAVRHGDELLVIYPLLKRAERYPLSDGTMGPARDAMAIFEAGFPRNRADMERQLRLVSLTSNNGSWEITLQPASRSTRRFLSEICVVLSTNDYALVATELVFTEGSRVRTDFTNAVTGQPPDQSLFQPKLGSDYTITQPLSK